MSNGQDRQVNRIDVALSFVGTLVPDEESFHNSAFSRAGNMYQENLVSALSSAGLQPDLILSQHPVAGFPRGQLWFRGRKVSLRDGTMVKLVGFINILPLRIVTVGLAVLVQLVRWGWRARGSKRIVYIYNLTEPSGLITLLAARLIKAKAIAAVVDINVPGETVAASWSRRLDFWIQRQLLGRFDGLTVVNDLIVQDFAPQGRFIRIEGGVKQSLLSHFLAASPSVTSKVGPFTIVSVGSLQEANGVLELLKAFDLLRDRDYCLTVAGTGPLQHEVEVAAKRDRRIKYCGFLSFAEVIDLYATADVLVNMRLTRRLDTQYFFPSKMMEYLASGVPVITTATGHVGAEYAEFVYLLHEETPEALAGMIANVAALNPESRRARGQRAQEFVSMRLTWEAQGQRLVQFIVDK
jgi:glycosyltransferase involved in cell wall biosynthesis